MPRLWNQTDLVAYHLGEVRQVRTFTPVSLSFSICYMGVEIPTYRVPMKTSGQNA